MLYQKEIAVSEEHDVVVCGGGFSGFAAACSAAREGVKVIPMVGMHRLGPA